MFLQIRTPYNYLLINLAIAELVLASAGVAFDILPLIHRGWPFGVNVCIGTGALITTSGMHFLGKQNILLTALFIAFLSNVVAN